MSIKILNIIIVVSLLVICFAVLFRPIQKNQEAPYTETPISTPTTSNVESTSDTVKTVPCKDDFMPITKSSYYTFSGFITASESSNLQNKLTGTITYKPLKKTQSQVTITSKNKPKISFIISCTKSGIIGSSIPVALFVQNLVSQNEFLKLLGTNVASYISFKILPNTSEYSDLDTWIDKPIKTDALSFLSQISDAVHLRNSLSFKAPYRQVIVTRNFDLPIKNQNTTTQKNEAITIKEEYMYGFGLQKGSIFVETNGKNKLIFEISVLKN